MDFVRKMSDSVQETVTGTFAGKGPVTELHCANHTTCSRRVIATAEEKGVEWRYHHVDFKSGQQRSEDFKKMQPFGKVPVLREGDFVLYESRAIMRYLASKPGGTPLVPAKPEVRALVDQVISVEFSYFTPAFYPIYFERHLKPTKGLGETDDARVAAAIDDLGPVLDRLDAMLEGKTYFVAEQFTLGDLTFLPYFEQFENLKIADTLAGRANVAAWFARCRARPAWAFAKDGTATTKAA